MAITRVKVGLSSTCCFQVRIDRTDLNFCSQNFHDFGAFTEIWRDFTLNQTCTCRVFLLVTGSRSGLVFRFCIAHTGELGWLDRSFAQASPRCLHKTILYRLLGPMLTNRFRCSVPILPYLGCIICLTTIGGLPNRLSAHSGQTWSIYVNSTTAGESVGIPSSNDDCHVALRVRVPANLRVFKVCIPKSLVLDESRFDFHHWSAGDGCTEVWHFRLDYSFDALSCFDTCRIPKIEDRWALANRIEIATQSFHNPICSSWKLASLYGPQVSFQPGLPGRYQIRWHVAWLT